LSESKIVSEDEDDYITAQLSMPMPAAAALATVATNTIDATPMETDAVYSTEPSRTASTPLQPAAATLQTATLATGPSAKSSSMLVPPTTSSHASSSYEDGFSPKPLNSVWVQLFVDNVEIGRATKVKLELGADVDDLATAVKQVYNNRLDGITAAELQVYAWKDTSPLRSDVHIDSALESGESIDSPIRVTARTPNQGMFIQHNQYHYCYCTCLMHFACFACFALHSIIAAWYTAMGNGFACHHQVC
jgi:hypothetical protein